MFSCMGETVFFAFAFTFLFYQIFEVLSNAQRWIYEVKLMPIECQISGLRDGEWCPIEKLNLETGGVPQGLVVGGGVEARN